MTYHQTIMEHEAMALQKGMEQEKLASLKAMIKKLKLSAEAAMDILDIPKEDYPTYKNLLQKYKNQLQTI